MVPKFSRYVALGDSQTEGLGDGDDIRGYRGWADRLAERLTVLNPDLLYANLAVRGRLAHEVRTEQLRSALALRPDLATVVAGLNDLLRPKFDAATVAGHLAAMFAELTAVGATVGTVTYPEIGRIMPIAKPLRNRVLDFNARIREVAARYDVVVVETFPHSVTTDPRIWSSDRLHASPLGHAMIAAAMANALGLPGSDDSWTRPLSLPRPTTSASAELVWLVRAVGPWLLRRVRGKSSGDGRSAKRPDLSAIQVDTPVDQLLPWPNRVEHLDQDGDIAQV